MKKIIVTLLVLLLFLSFAACSSAYKGENDNETIYGFTDGFKNNESFDTIKELPFVSVSQKATSNISLNANTAAYSIIRNAIMNKRTVNTNSVRTEELVNFFSYSSYESPLNDEVAALNYGLADCPWNGGHKLLTVGLKTKEIDFAATDNNIVFLIDTSGSMYGSDRLDLVKEAFNLLINSLNENDTITIVTYAGSTKVVIEGESDKIKIAKALDDLSANGSTNGSSGIKLAYDAAKKYFKSNGNNRVILATDGDFNVGITNKTDLQSFIKEKASEENIYLSVLGFGYGNTKDSTMEALANNGNGNYTHISNSAMAKQAMVKNLNGTLVTVAKDTKAQVTFSDKVDSYRLIGYENKQLTDEEYKNDKTDAGEIGSGLVVTAVYEVVLSDTAVAEDNLATFAVKYKLPTDDSEAVSKEIFKNVVFSEMTAARLEDVKFISAVVEFSLILRDSQYKGNASLSSVLARLESMSFAEEDILKLDFKNMVEFYSSYK